MDYGGCKPLAEGNVIEVLELTNMITCHRGRRDGTTPGCRSRRIANVSVLEGLHKSCNTFSESWLQKSCGSAGLRTAPATQ